MIKFGIIIYSFFNDLLLKVKITKEIFQIMIKYIELIMYSSIINQRQCLMLDFQY